jgi:hypothetical protein
MSLGANVMLIMTCAQAIAPMVPLEDWLQDPGKRSPYLAVNYYANRGSL